MHERIKELVGHVEKYISTTNFEGMPEDEMTYDEIFQKKFAELIVKEVTNIVLHYTDVDEGVAVAKKHFGVEE